MSERRCTVVGCDRKHYGRGWCYAHYARWYATGNVNADVPIGSHSSEIVHGTCDGYSNHGCRCRPCRNAWAAAVRASVERRAARAPCAVVGCDGGNYARGLCRAHYERQRTGRPLTPHINRKPGARGVKVGKRRSDVG